MRARRLPAPSAVPRPTCRSPSATSSMRAPAWRVSRSARDGDRGAARHERAAGVRRSARAGPAVREGGRRVALGEGRWAISGDRGAVVGPRAAVRRRQHGLGNGRRAVEDHRLPAARRAHRGSREEDRSARRWTPCGHGRIGRKRGEALGQGRRAEGARALALADVSVARRARGQCGHAGCRPAYASRRSTTRSHRHSPRSSQTVGAPGSSPGSTWTTRGRQHTGQSSVYVWCSPPPGSTYTCSRSPQKGHATEVGADDRRRRFFTRPA